MQTDAQSAAQEYVDTMARERGYVLDYHKVMAKHDLPVLEAANGLVRSAYLAPRLLDAKTKELLFVLSLTVLRGPAPQLRSHIKLAQDLGASDQEILEAIEIALPEAGVVAFQHGFEAWCDAVGAEGLEPTVAVHDEASRDRSAGAARRCGTGGAAARP